MNDVEKMDYLILIFIWEITTKMLLWYVFLKNYYFSFFSMASGSLGSDSTSWQRWHLFT